MQDKAVEKLRGSKSLDENGKIVAEYLAERCREDASMAEDVLHEKKTMAGCMAYVREQAKKQAKNGMAMVKDSVVYEWAEDYFRQDPSKMKDGPKEKTEKVAKAERKKAVEPLKTPEKDGKKAGASTIGGTGKKTTVEHEEPRKQSAKKKKNDEIDGQMSLFDFMGA